VKVLKQTGLTEAVMRQFTDEADTMAELAEHPNIVSVSQADTTSTGRPYLVMSLYPGQNLGERARSQPISVAEAVQICIKVAGAVETAHRAGIVHRDIKPANILVSAYGEPALADFGIAGRTADVGADDDVGVSIPWAPPEVVSGTSNGSIQADVYSLAATLWELLVGRSPFEVARGDNSARALTARVLQTPPPRTGRADAPDSLERLLQLALAKRPEVRPATALELARGLQAVEREQRFSATEIRLLDDRSAVSRARTATPPQDATRVRAPLRVEAQPPATPPPVRRDRAADATWAPVDRTQQGPAADTTRPPVPVVELRGGTATSAPPPPRDRAPVPRDAPLPGTVRRPVRAAEPSDAAGMDVARPRPARRTPLVLAAAAAVVVAAVVGVVLTSQGSSNAPASSEVTPTTDGRDQSPVDTGPGLPVVTGTRVDPGTLRFAWTYDNAQPTDGFIWKAGDGVEHPVTTPTVDVPASGRTCLQVEVRRPGGSALLPFSAPVCVD
jgi:hypothetical protein